MGVANAEGEPAPLERRLDSGPLTDERAIASDDLYQDDGFWIGAKHFASGSGEEPSLLMSFTFDPTVTADPDRIVFRGKKRPKYAWNASRRIVWALVRCGVLKLLV